MRHMHTRHFDIPAWADFARGLGSPTGRAAMTRHLAAGCRRCQSRFDVMKGVASAAQVGLEAPPESALRHARALFSANRPRTESPGRLAARLFFDSFRAPLPAGVRSAPSAVRQAVYRAGEFDVDVRLEYDALSPRVALVGQIAHRQRPDTPVPSVLVTMTAGTEIVATATANSLGEFQLQYSRRRGLRLHLPLESHGRWIDVSLATLEDHGPEPGGATRRTTQRQSASGRGTGARTGNRRG